MLESLPWYIGLRYIRSKRRNGFIAFVSLFALLGMMLGVFALIVVLSVMNGFDRELKQRILRVVPHGFIEKSNALQDWVSLSDSIRSSEGLLGSAPFIEGKGLITYGNRVRPIQIEGIAPSQETEVSEISRSILVGDYHALEQTRYGIVLGALIARNMGVSIGDKVSVTLPIVSITPAGVFPRSKRFTVVGVFEVGAQVDQTLALINLQDAQKLFRLPNRVHGLRLRFDDIYRAPAYLGSIIKQLNEKNEHAGFKGKDWSQTQGSLFQAVKMEKTVVGIMLSVIIAVAAFNIITSLIMMVAEKRSDIAVLRTLGLSRSGIMKVFVVQGSVMGLCGIIVGAGSGIITAHYLPEIIGFFEGLVGAQVFDPSVYFVSHLPSEWKLNDTLWTCAFAFVISFLATLYPAYRASLIEPAEALRYDT